MNQNDATLSPQLKDTFQRCLVKYGLPEHEHSHYHRWLKMYFAFCQKYEFHPPASRSKLSFIREIESQKRYAQKYIHQADYAIQIYHKIFKVVQSKRQDQNQELGWDQSMNKLTEAIQLRHYSKQTLRSYLYWVKRYRQFHNSKQPLECAGLEITKFLSFLAIKEQVAPATQNQAFNALLFFYRHALEMPNVEIKGVIRAKEKVRVPEIMTLQEVHTVISHLPQKYQLIGKLLYGSGMRLSECLNLRVQDFDFDEMKIRVIRGKGRKSRTVPLPRALEKELRAHLEALQKAFETHPQRVFLPKLLEKKYPNAGLQWRWQWVFPAFQNTYIKEQDIEKRSHLHPTHLQRAMVKAVDKSGIAKKVSAHTFRHSFASHLLQSGVDIRTIQELLGHSDLKTTMVYTHTVKEPASLGAMSPLDLQRV